MPFSSEPKNAYKLVTVNTAPERAARLIGQVIDQLKDSYVIEHVKNVEKIEDVRAAVEAVQPDLLFSASMWTPAEASQIRAIAQEAQPNIKTLALPQGLQVQQGPDAVVEHLKHAVPQLLGDEQ